MCTQNGMQAILSFWMFSLTAMINSHRSTPFLELAPSENGVQRESPVVYTALLVLATSLVILPSPKLIADYFCLFCETISKIVLSGTI